MSISESTMSARRVHGLMHKPCLECGTDISRRNHIARFCEPCVQKRAKANIGSGKKRERTRICAVCGAAANAKAIYCEDCCRDNHGVRAAITAVVNKAIAVGLLPKAGDLLCLDCGAPAECWDHRDYNKPLDVEPVCHGCNLRRGPALPRRVSLLRVETRKSVKDGDGAAA